MSANSTDVRRCPDGHTNQTACVGTAVNTSTELGCSAKIAPTADLPPTERAVCCVYVDDFADRAEVQRVLHALQRLEVDVTSGFKPDVYTELNIMRNNAWRLEPTIYKVAEALEWPEGIARAAYPKVRATPWG